MKKHFWCLCTFLFFTAYFTCVSGAQETTHKYILDNGLVVLITETPSSPAVAFNALVKCGSAAEEKFLGAGISHFVEHMLFKGTERRGPGEIATEVRALGGVINASTSFDYTMYTIELPSESFLKGIDILADMLMNSQFDPAQTEKEREVIFGEIRMREDNPESFLNQLIFTNAYQRHPYRHPIIGYDPLLRAVSRDELFEYYHTHYIPNNMVLSIAGNVAQEEALEAVKNAFGSFKPQAYLLRNLPPEPLQLTSRFYEKAYPSKLARMSLTYQGVSLTHRDMYALDVLAMLLGQGESSRLYKNVYQTKELVYGISSGNYTPLDQGLFEISCTLEESNIEKTLAAIRAEVDAVRKNGVTPDELKKAKRQVLSQFVFTHQQAADIAEDAAKDEAFIGDFQFSKKYVKEIEAVTVNDIKRVAGAYLVDSRSTLVILKPESEKAAPPVLLSSKELPEIKKIVFENGLKVLLKEDHSFPLVSMRLVLEGGLRQETEANNGISNLVSNLWTKGTKKNSAEEVSRSVEERGMSLNSFSGQNSFGLSMETLDEDLGFGLNLFEDLVKNPQFPEDEFKKAKTQALSAIKNRDDDIFASYFLKMKQALFLTHPYRFDTLGTIKSVEALTRRDLLDFYERLRVPSNMVLAVFGDFDGEKIVGELKTRFSSLPPKQAELKAHSEAVQAETRQVELTFDKQQAIVAVGFQGPTLKSDDRYGLEIIASILGSSLNGRIFLKIRDELGQAYTLGGYFMPGVDSGLVYFYVSTTAENADKVKKVLLEQISDLAKNPVGDSELADTKTYLKGTQKMSLETNSSLAAAVSFDELYGLGFAAYRDYDGKIDKVTKEDVQRLAQSYLSIQKAVVLTALPKPGLNP